MQSKDLDEVVEALTLAIVRQETEERFFRRSAEKTNTEEARALFLSIAEGLKQYRERLEDKKIKYVASKEHTVERKQEMDDLQ
jgi:rubrerythrin